MLKLSAKTTELRAGALVPSSTWVLDRVAGASAPSDDVAHGFPGWRCQPSPATQKAPPWPIGRCIYISTMADAFPLTCPTKVLVAAKSGEAVLARCRVV